MKPPPPPPPAPPAPSPPPHGRPTHVKVVHRPPDFRLQPELGVHVGGLRQQGIMLLIIKHQVWLAVLVGGGGGGGAARV